MLCCDNISIRDFFSDGRVDRRLFYTPNLLQIILHGRSIDIKDAMVMHMTQRNNIREIEAHGQRLNTCSISSCGLICPPLGRISVTADMMNASKLIPIRRNLIYQLQNHFLGVISAIRSGKRTPDTPMIICCQFVSRATLHITYGTGKRQNSLISAPTAKAAIKWPLSCTNGYPKTATTSPIMIIPNIVSTSEKMCFFSLDFNELTPLDKHLFCVYYFLFMWLIFLLKFR